MPLIAIMAISTCTSEIWAGSRVNRGSMKLGAGASTVTEIAAVGAAALFVPFPFAVDDHQTTNARFLVEAGGAWLVPQPAFTPRSLADTLLALTRGQLVETASKAHAVQKTGAVAAVVSACEQLAKVKTT